MRLEDITPLILTYNEEANIERVLGALQWARQILVIDSGSSDSTHSVVARFSNASLIYRQFDNHSAQWNFGLEQASTPWVLALDADYICPKSLPDELCALHPQHNAYVARFRYSVFGRQLRGTLYPPRIVLFRSHRFRHVMDGHTQRLIVGEATGELQSIILHDDRKPLSRWLADQNRYADLEVEQLLTRASGQLGWKDRLRKQIIWAAPATMFYCLFAKGLILNGWPGWHYTLQRVYAELILSLKLLDAKLNGGVPRQVTNDSNSPSTEMRVACDVATKIQDDDAA